MDYDIAIVGAGIVGLATALQINQKRPELKIIVIEKENKVAAHQTGNNSGVIHSGIYYKPGSLKAKNCIEGYHLMINFCKENNIPIDMCGKIIVATSEAEIPALTNIYNRGIENGLTGLKYIDEKEIKEIEPYTNGVKGIFVPQTGIVDYKVVANKYSEIFQKNGGELVLNTKVVKISKKNDLIYIKTSRFDLQTKLVINCAGLYSDKIASLTIPDLEVKIVPFRGEYYSLNNNKRHLVNNLIYPVPDPNFPFLGVHFTRRIDGEIEAGPNAVLAFQREGYTKSQINIKELFETLTWKGFQKVAIKYWKTGIGEMYRSFSKKAFTIALQKLMPSIQPQDLKQGGAGVRAQACDKNGGLIDDFYIKELPGQIHVLNAPSPAATSSLSIGNTIAELAFKQFS
ncbi:MAG: L-2-hydroxyglutarate oxidase [Bacteroidota bacterium]|nr:L-2-hydroxyglutarate oxidase [Bacteroidota bacterium]